MIERPQANNRRKWLDGVYHRMVVRAALAATPRARAKEIIRRFSLPLKPRAVQRHMQQVRLRMLLDSIDKK